MLYCEQLPGRKAEVVSFILVQGTSQCNSRVFSSRLFLVVFGHVRYSSKKITKNFSPTNDVTMISFDAVLSYSGMFFLRRNENDVSGVSRFISLALHGQIFCFPCKCRIRAVFTD